MTLDTSKIDELFLKENYILGLNFTDYGNVFFRVNSREFVPYVYDEIGDVESKEWVDSARLGNAAKDITNVLKVDNCNEIYQVFMGISPGAVRAYLHYPVESIGGNLDEMNNFSKSPFGFVDGFMSPFNQPSPITEVFIPKDMKVGWAWYNPTNETKRVMLNLMIVKYKVSVIRDTDLVDRILTGQKSARLASIGGTDRLTYNFKNTWDITPVPFGSTTEEIQSALNMSTSN